MYEEANLQLWTTNTFTFEDSSLLTMFLDSFIRRRRKKFTRMHIDFTWDNSSARQWERALHSSLISRVKGLRTLHTTFDQDVGMFLPSHFPSVVYYQLNMLETFNPQRKPCLYSR